MHKLNIYFSPFYIISSFFIIYLGGLNTFCFYFVALCLHEASHYFVSKRLGYSFNNLSFLPYGAKLNGNTNYKKISHEIIIALVGPLFNIFIALIIMAFWWVKPILYGYTLEFVQANLFLGFFNLLPLFPLDGGQVFLNVFTTFKSKKIAYKIMQIIGIIISVLFMVIFIYSAFNEINFSSFFISLFLFISSINSYNVDYKKGVENIAFKLYDVCECRKFIVNENTNFLKLSKKLNANYFSYFIFVDNNFKEIKTLSQTEILTLISNGKYYLN